MNMLPPSPLPFCENRENEAKGRSASEYANLRGWRGEALLEGGGGIGFAKNIREEARSGAAYLQADPWFTGVTGAG